jgi:hypothetical protein
MSNEMKQYLDKNGIEALHTVRASPQNGVAERANRTLDEGVITLLKEAGLPPIFWGEALACFVHTRNRCPPIQTPYELWNGSKPTVEHLRVFGSTAWVHVGKDKRKKLQSHTIKCFLNYPTSYKGWKFWDPVGKKCIISRDVIFDERSLHPATSTPQIRLHLLCQLHLQLHHLLHPIPTSFLLLLTIPTVLHQNPIFLVHFLRLLILSVGVPLLLLHSIQWELTRMSSHLHTILHHLQHLPLEELPGHLSLQQSGGRMLLII